MFDRILKFFRDLFSQKPVYIPAPPSVPGVDDYKQLPWMKIAYTYVGVHEIAGPKAHPKIAEWLKGVGQNGSDEIAWCAAAANGILKEAGYKHTKRATARSLMDAGTKLTEFKPGCIVVLWRGSISGWQGHVAFGEKLSANGKQVRLLGGNQGDEFNSSWYSTDRVLGYIWPEKL